MIGPCLPYDDYAIQVLEIKNDSEYDAELFSLDFDKRYIKEEAELSKYKALQGKDSLPFAVRLPGEPFWENILKDNEHYGKVAELEK